MACSTHGRMNGSVYDLLASCMGGGGSGSECVRAELAWKMQDTLTIMVVQSKQIKM